MTLGNEPLRFRNDSEDVLASKKPPGGLEDACLRFPKRGVELPGGFPGRWNQIWHLGTNRCVFATFRRTFWRQKSPREALKMPV